MEGSRSVPRVELSAYLSLIHELSALACLNSLYKMFFWPEVAE